MEKVPSCGKDAAVTGQSWPWGEHQLSGHNQKTSSYASQELELVISDPEYLSLQTLPGPRGGRTEMKENGTLY